VVVNYEVVGLAPDLAAVFIRMSEMRISHDESLATLERTLNEDHNRQLRAMERQLRNEREEVGFLSGRPPPSSLKDKGVFTRTDRFPPNNKRVNRPKDILY
jgi:hypothetical protein